MGSHVWKGEHLQKPMKSIHADREEEYLTSVIHLGHLTLAVEHSFLLRVKSKFGMEIMLSFHTKGELAVILPLLSCICCSLSISHCTACGNSTFNPLKVGGLLCQWGTKHQQAFMVFLSLFMFLMVSCVHPRWWGRKRGLDHKALTSGMRNVAFKVQPSMSYQDITPF